MPHTSGMGIRFYVPLPGPFAYVPGKKHPKPQGESTTAAAGNILTRIAANVGQRIYDDAHDYAVSKGAADPHQFALDVNATAKGNYIRAFGIGLASTLAYWIWQMGFGTLLLVIIPVVNLAAIGVPTLVIGLVIAGFTNHPTKLYDTVSTVLKHDLTGKHRAADDDEHRADDTATSER